MDIESVFNESRGRIEHDYQETMKKMREKYYNMVMNLNVLYHACEAAIQPKRDESNMIRSMLESGCDNNEELLRSRLSEIESEIEDLQKRFYSDSYNISNEDLA